MIEGSSEVRQWHPGDAWEIHLFLLFSRSVLIHLRCFDFHEITAMGAGEGYQFVKKRGGVRRPAITSDVGTSCPTVLPLPPPYFFPLPRSLPSRYCLLKVVGSHRPVFRYNKLPGLSFLALTPGSSPGVSPFLLQQNKAFSARHAAGATPPWPHRAAPATSRDRCAQPSRPPTGRISAIRRRSSARCAPGSPPGRCPRA